MLFAAGGLIGTFEHPFTESHESVVQTLLSLQFEELSVLMHLFATLSPVTYDPLQTEVRHLFPVHTGTIVTEQEGPEVDPDAQILSAHPPVVHFVNDLTHCEVTLLND